MVDNRTKKKDKDEIVFSLRIASQLYEELKRVAEKEGRSVNSQILYWVRRGLEAYKP
jgi:hypothetical protein